MNSMKWLVVGLWLTITAVLCIISYNNGASTAVVTADTIEVVKWDTIVQTKPIAVIFSAYGCKMVKVPENECVVIKNWHKKCEDCDQAKQENDNE